MSGQIFISYIDLPAEDLQKRLEAGKIYPKERAEAALENFFTTEHLTRLREASEQESNVGGLGQVMVAISSHGPDPERLLRKTARLAAQLNAQWYAVYVRTPDESVVKIDAEVQRRVLHTLEAAQKMGGLVILKWRKQEDLHSKPFGPFRLANESGALVRFNFQKCPRSDSHRDWIGFEPIFSALEYAGESGAPCRIRTDILPGLSRFSLRWNTGAKDPPSGRAPDYSQCHGMRRFLRFGGIKWLPEEGSHRRAQNIGRDPHES